MYTVSQYCLDTWKGSLIKGVPALVYQEGRHLIFIFNMDILFLKLLIYLFLAALGLHSCMWVFSSCSKRGLLFVVVCGLQACGLQQLQHAGSVVVAHGLQSAGSVVVAHGLICSAACGIFPDQGQNPCPVHWQADS